MIPEKTFITVAQENNFSWANMDDNFQSHIIREFQNERVYDWFYQVQLGDVVVDIGASVGPFSMMSAERCALKLYMIEPSSLLLTTALANCSKYLFNRQEPHIIPINCAIGDDCNDITVFSEDIKFEMMTFKQLITQYNISKIDFLKVDCEGGEYSIFVDENINFLKYNVKHVAMEVHLKYDNCRQKFVYFRDNILPHFPKWEVRSCVFNPLHPGMFVDLKPYLYSNEFVDSYQCEFMIYIGKYCKMPN